MADAGSELVARLRRAYGAFNRGDLDTAVAEMRLDTEFELVRAGFGGQGPIKGALAYREWLEPDAIEAQLIEPVDFHVVGMKVLVQQHGSGRGAASGIELSIDTWAVWTFNDDGDAVRVEAFAADEKSAAFRAAGLSEHRSVP